MCLHRAAASQSTQSDCCCAFFTDPDHVPVPSWPQMWPLDIACVPGHVNCKLTGLNATSHTLSQIVKSSCTYRFIYSPSSPAAPACLKASTKPLPYHSENGCPLPFIISQLAHLSSIQNKCFSASKEGRKEGSALLVLSHDFLKQPVDFLTLCGAMISLEVCKYLSRIVSRMNSTSSALQVTVVC